MAKLMVQIDKEKDLPALKAVLNQLGLEYQVEEDNWGELSDAEVNGIKAGMEDIKAGRSYTNEEASVRIANKLKQLGLNQ